MCKREAAKYWSKSALVVIWLHSTEYITKTQIKLQFVSNAYTWKVDLVFSATNSGSAMAPNVQATLCSSTCFLLSRQRSVTQHYNYGHVHKSQLGCNKYSKHMKRFEQVVWWTRPQSSHGKGYMWTKYLSSHRHLFESRSRCSGVYVICL